MGNIRPTGVQLAAEIEAPQRRLLDLQARVGTRAPTYPQLLEQTFTELLTTLEELRAAEEMLVEKKQWICSRLRRHWYPNVGATRGARRRPPAGPYVVVEVVDTGMEMDAATQAGICEPFFTAKGLGLGLAREG